MLTQRDGRTKEYLPEVVAPYLKWLRANMIPQYAKRKLKVNELVIT